MERVKAHRFELVFAGSLLAPLGLAACLVPFRSSFANTAAALLFIAVIAVCAVAGNRLTGVTASVSSAIWFDFFLATPYGRLTINRRPDLETTICIVVVGLIVTELATRSRRHLETANDGAMFVRMIHDLGELVSGTASGLEAIRQTESLLTELLSLRACRYEIGQPPRPRARIKPDGEIVHAKIHWPAHEIGIPGPEAAIPVRWRGQPLGRFVLTPTPGLPVGVDRRITAVALVDFVGAALSDQQEAA